MLPTRSNVSTRICSELRRNIFKSVLNKSVTIFNQPWIWFKTDWFRADWFLRKKMLLSPIFRAFQLIKGHTKCFSDILITIDHSTCSLWYLIQSALNQSALNQIQGRLKKVTFLFKADLKIFVQGFLAQNSLVWTFLNLDFQWRNFMYL